MIEIISRLEKSGELKKLIRCGFVSSKLILYYEVFLEYDKEIKTGKTPSRQMIADIADTFRISEPTVYRIIKMFKEE